MHDFHFVGDKLFCERVPVDSLVKKFGTPLYVYSRQAMLAALAPYQKALQGRPHLVCYAVKANSNLAVLQTFAEAGCGFDIVSEVNPVFSFSAYNLHVVIANNFRIVKI